MLHKCLSEWVLQYKQLYYQGSTDHVSLCPVTVHSLLHLADCMEWTGPLWTTWAFPMEQVCSQLQRAVTGHLNPYPGID
ncbi:hypothetical protein DACRYDRAFT_54109 [Dacryopinax primogenitus]|uniref:DUF4218 domain-containing protein n=1 Tax=Dacryopinax primogenitus (strain DJM 731) TaxID=1858805 RepID=M5FXW1_DACPD|nr:uncharacterized protein DACRYDRAFT_54109 [Dacryopinax primogenitus]EJU00620.1 hypothetical protein DACRYDRAFT_54109 [Dacryopinax primogenitus]